MTGVPVAALEALLSRGPLTVRLVLESGGERVASWEAGKIYEAGDTVTVEFTLARLEAGP